MREGFVVGEGVFFLQVLIFPADCKTLYQVYPTYVVYILPCDVAATV